MTPHKFSVGRRVRKRGTSKKGYIMHLDSCHARVKWDDPLFQGGESSTALDLLKLLKPKPQAEVKAAEDWWVHKADSGLVYMARQDSTHGGFHVREVLPNSITITKEQFKEQWPGVLDFWFDQVSKSIGFEDSK